MILMNILNKSNMKFTLFVSTESKCKNIREKCCEILTDFLKKEGYFDVGFNPKEIDIDKLGKA